VVALRRPRARPSAAPGFQLAFPDLFATPVETPSPDRRALLFGRDETLGIVSVTADRAGQAFVWRRVDGRIVCEEERFSNWFFLSRRDLLGDLPVVDLDMSMVRSGARLAPGETGVVQLHGENHFGSLVLTDRLDEVEARVSEATKLLRAEDEPEEPLSRVMYVRPPAEQYMTISGRTYFKGMAYADLRRMQFDLETTGLGFDFDRIFMVSIKDSDGFTAVLDIGRMDEAELIRELARIVRERDPDVIENHNIFDFDIRFLVKRAQDLGVPLLLGRDGTEFRESRDSVKIGAQNHSFTRYSLAGREIIDTLHATRRFSAIQRDLRSNGLKEAAQYFGFAAEDREYVKGPEIWRTFQEDPERIRRYCWDDVEEVDGLSQVLLGPSFALASMVPKPYERIATSGTGQGLIEPLLVRAYLAAGESLPTGKDVGAFAGGTTAVFTTGVVQNVVKADVASLYPSIMLTERIGPATDRLGVFLDLLGDLTSLRLDHKARAKASDVAADRRSYHEAMQAAMKVLINSFYGMLGAGFASFCDGTAAARVAARGREVLDLLLDELRRRDAILIEADTDGVLFSLPPNPDERSWSYEDELALIEDVAHAMPAGIQLEHDGRYAAMYSYMEKNYALLDYEPLGASPPDPRDYDSLPPLGEAAGPVPPLPLGEAGEGPIHRSEVGEGAPPTSRQARDPIRLVGSAFRSTRAEPFIEQTLAATLGLILRGRAEDVRGFFRSCCDALRRHEVPLADLCVSMPLSKTPETYAQSGRKEEPYEVFLAAGNSAWKSGHRVLYYQTKTGKRLVTPEARDYDADFYIDKLAAVSKQRLEKAFTPADLQLLLSEFDGLFDPPMSEVRTLTVTSRRPIVWEAEQDTESLDSLGGGVESA
jgi:DNA polymerase, archaea type